MNTIDLLFVGIGCGLLARLLARYAPDAVPKAGLAAQGVLGVYTGMMVHSVSFSALGSDWPVVITVAVGTLAISIVGGALLGMHRDVTPLTGALALVAGGASGVVAIARELGGDDRVVAAIQYLRVALITASMPVVVMIFFHNSHTNTARASETASLPWYLSIIAVAVIVVVGTIAGRTIRLPGAGLLGPLAITIALELTGMTEGLAVPMLLVQAGLMLIVWQTVLAFTRDSLRAIRRILPGALALILLLNLAAAGLGMILADFAGLTNLDGYLATSPGGIYAVLGTAAGMDSNVPFIMAAQVIRIVLMLFAAPLIAKVFLRFSPHATERSTSSDEPAQATN